MTSLFHVQNSFLNLLFLKQSHLLSQDHFLLFCMWEQVLSHSALAIRTPRAGEQSPVKLMQIPVEKSGCRGNVEQHEGSGFIFSTDLLPSLAQDDSLIFALQFKLPSCQVVCSSEPLGQLTDCTHQASIGVSYRCFFTGSKVFPKYTAS